MVTAPVLTRPSTTRWASAGWPCISGLIDGIHLAISPVLLGRGENLLGGIDLVSLGYRCTEHAATDDATHVVLTR
jgi:hypothetical protein